MANVLLIVYDNGSHIPFFPQGIAYLAGALKKGGHSVEIYQQDITHRSDEHLTAYLDNHTFDVVGLGFCAGYYQYRKCLAIAKAVNLSRHRGSFRFVLGGHGPAAEPAYFRDKFEADIVVIGDGEGTLIDTADGYWVAGTIDGTSIHDVDTLPWPAYELFPIETYRLIRWPTSNRTDLCMPILSGRGCKWHCSFCYRMDEGFRPRNPEAVLEEMLYLNKTWGINHFQFSDELFMSSKDRIHTFCETILRTWDDVLKDGAYKWVKWDCNGRLNYADKETLTIMKRAGCEYINYGIESLDQTLLNEMKKGLTIDQIYTGIENTLELGLTPGLNLIWGFPGDTLENLQKAVDFLIKYDTCRELRTIRPVTPYPGCPLYYQAIKEGKLEGPEDFYEHKHVNSDLLTVNWMDLDNAEFHGQLFKANWQLIKNYYDKHRESAFDEALDLYRGQNNNFRGFRTV